MTHTDHNEDCITFEQAADAATTILPCSPLVVEQKQGTLDQQLRQLAERLLAVPPAVKDWRLFCGRVLWFCHDVRRLQQQNLDSLAIQRWLIDLTDYCDGVPVDGEVKRMLYIHYSRQSSYRIKILASECLGRMRGGLAHAEQLLRGLLQVEDVEAQPHVQDAMRRILNAQLEFASNTSHLVLALNAERTSTLQSIGRFRSLLRQSAVAHDFCEDVLAGIRGMSTSLLVAANEKDEDVFLRHKKWLLRDHLGEFVAIREGELLGFAKSRRKLQELLTRVEDDARVFIEEITPEAFERKNELPWEME